MTLVLNRTVLLGGAAALGSEDALPAPLLARPVRALPRWIRVGLDYLQGGAEAMCCHASVTLIFSLFCFCDRFTKLKSLNLSNNHLGDFPLAVCNIPTLAELNMSCNALRAVPATVGAMHK